MARPAGIELHRQRNLAAGAVGRDLGERRIRFKYIDGDRQRAALAVGIAAGPGLLLVDEPTSQLDTAGRDEVLVALEAVNAKRHTTIVVVTHDLEVGARLGRVVTIRDGRVGAAGRDGQDFAVVAGDGTIQLPPEVLGDFPPGTLLLVDHEEGEVRLQPGGR